MEEAGGYGDGAMPLFPWGKRYEAVKRAEGLLEECCQHLALGEKRLGKTGREWISRRRWNDDPAEMRCLIYYAALAAPGPELEAAHFPPRRRCDHEAFAKAQFEGMALEDAVRHKVAHFFAQLGSVEAADVHRTVLSQVERPLIEECLRWAGGNQLKAARVLGLCRATLRKRMRELSIAGSKRTRDTRHETRDRQ